jgi:hypothetical protein
MSETPVTYPVVLNSRVVNLIAAVLLTILALLLFTSVRQESQTFDESTPPLRRLRVLEARRLRQKS